MVRTLTLAVLLVLSSVALARRQAPPPPPPPMTDEGSRFAIEFSKREIWEGEQLYCHFMLYAEDDALEVEVAKFPEFRGYWSENLALRQGPIPLLRESGLGLLRRAIVGTYLITPMLNRTDHSIEPMKLIVRRILGSANEPAITFLSTIPKLVVKKLPTGAPKSFHGAVGNLFLQPESTQIRFRNGEPTALRLLLQGEGNFPEVNEIAVDFPPFVEIVSRRASLMGSGQFASKTFEITLTPNTDADFELPRIEFTSFNPVTGQYETRATDPIRFIKETKPALPPMQEADPDRLTKPERHWSTYRPLGKSFLYWLLQAALLSGFLVAIGREVRKRARARYLLSEAYRRRLRWDVALAAWDGKELESFLRLADDLAYDILRERAGLGHRVVSRAEALRAAAKKLPPEIIADAERLFTAHERYAYTGEASPPPEDLLGALERLVRSR